MNCVLIGWAHDRNSRIWLSLGVLKSSEENVIMVFLLSVLPTFSIKETIHHFPVQILGEIIKKNFYWSVFPIYVIVIFNLDH